MKNLAHSASFQPVDKIAPSKPGIKHLGHRLIKGEAQFDIPALYGPHTLYIGSARRRDRLAEKNEDVNQGSGSMAGLPRARSSGLEQHYPCRASGEFI